MKNITKAILSILILIFAFFTISNYSYAVEGDTASLDSSSNSSVETSATVSTTSSADDGIFSPTNIINILLIAVGLVLVFLAIAILTRLKSK